ncbi:MAG: ubiquitin-like small modifier protein 2 [Haloarculaceae archaeon]
MNVTVELVGTETRTVQVSEDATYADLLAPLDVNRHEVSVMVDGRPVPEDRSVEGDVETVRVVRIVRGG